MKRPKMVPFKMRSKKRKEKTSPPTPKFTKFRFNVVISIPGEETEEELALSMRRVWENNMTRGVTMKGKLIGIE